MSAAAVADAVREAMATRERHAGWLYSDKTRLRCAVIDPILWMLGWRTWMPSECQHNRSVRREGSFDYVMLEPDGQVAIVILVTTSAPPREHNRRKLATLVSGVHRGVAVLTNGTRWEIYDLSLPPRGLVGKIVENFTLDTSDPVESEDAALALDYWLGKDSSHHDGQNLEQ